MSAPEIRGVFTAPPCPHCGAARDSVMQYHDGRGYLIVWVCTNERCECRRWVV